MKKKLKRKKMVVPKHVWGALIGAGVSTISGIVQNSEAKRQQRLAERAAFQRSLQQRALGDAIEFDEYNEEGYENASYYLAKGGKLKEPNLAGMNIPFDTMGGTLDPLSMTMQKVDGNKHNESTEDGTEGVKLIPKGSNEPIAEVEDNEVIADGEMVFSDRLKYKGKKTYADQATKIGKQIGEQEEKLQNLPDMRTKNTAERKLAGLTSAKNLLFLDQESKKAKRTNKKLAKGGKIPKLENGGKTFAQVMEAAFDTGTSNPIDWKQGLNSVIPYVDNVTNMLLTANTPQVEKPTFTKPMSLDTEYNVNPQIGTIRDAVNTGNKTIQDNTSSSNVARSNLTANKLAGAKEINSILASKQNAETNLRNQQAQMTYQHQAMDAAKMDQYSAKNRMRANAIQGKISQNIAQGVDDYLRGEDNKAKEAYQNKQLDLEAQRYTSGIAVSTLLDNPDYMRGLEKDPGRLNAFAKNVLRKNDKGDYVRPNDAIKFLTMYPDFNTSNYAIPTTTESDNPYLD